MTARSSPRPRSSTNISRTSFPSCRRCGRHDPVGEARMRYWNKFVDEQVMNYVSMHGWHRMVGIIARNIESGEFEKLLEHIPLPSSARNGGRRARASPRPTSPTRRARSRSRSTRSRRSSRETRVAGGRQLHARRHQFLFALRDDGRADVPRDGDRRRCPRLVEWRERVTARPATQQALAMPDHTAPGLRTWSGAR